MRTINNLWPRINNLVPSPICRTFGDDYDSIIWLDDRPMPTANELEAENPYRGELLKKINADVNTYICTHYDLGTQASLQSIYVMDGTPAEVKTTLLGVWSWIGSMLVYYYAKKTEITESETPETVTWDFTQFDATDPEVSLQTLISR